MKLYPMRKMNHLPTPWVHVALCQLVSGLVRSSLFHAVLYCRAYDNILTSGKIWSIRPLSSQFSLVRTASTTKLTQCSVNVTGSEKRAHLAQEFKIELLVLKGRVALKQ